MAKYKICSSMKNKNLVSNIVKAENIKSKGGIKRKHKPKFTQDLLIEFMGKQRAFNTRIEKEVSSIRSDIKNIENRLNSIVKLNNLKKHINLILIKNEIKKIDL